uniref:Uncharacterized protein n=1 Tax=Acrobeloides nanus TaxID=290746 RepID=A0A914D0P5_9BILA
MVGLVKNVLKHAYSSAIRKSAVAAITLAEVLAVIPLTSGAQCPDHAELYWQEFTTCNDHVIEVWSIKDTGDYCWLPDPRAKERNRSCLCPFWEERCSFYAKSEPSLAIGNSTIKLPAVKQALESLRPAICSFNKTPSCDPLPVQQNLMRVQLYDVTTHYVSKFNMVWQDRWKDEYVCIGHGNRITGSKHYSRDTTATTMETGFASIDNLRSQYDGITTALNVLPKGQDICLLLSNAGKRPAGHITIKPSNTNNPVRRRSYTGLESSGSTAFQSNDVTPKAAVKEMSAIISHTIPTFPNSEQPPTPC